MGRDWKIGNLFLGFVLTGLCSGFPVRSENPAAEYHSWFLTALVGVLIAVCGIVFLVGCLCCRNRNGFKEFRNSPVVASSTSSLDHGHINPIANGEFTIFTPLSSSLHNNNVFFANGHAVGQNEIDYNHADIDVSSWFDGSESNFPRTKLKYIKELGKGWFGRVVEGTAQGVHSDEEQTWFPVAVRILEASATSSERVVFLHDVAIYRCGDHPHILQLLGRSLESVPLLLLQEFCPHGDLKKYLKAKQKAADKLLTSDLPLLWCCQLSSALKHLHDHKLTHPDLATRNCQLVDDLNLKLGDYGLAANLYPEDYYQGAPAIPVRWCAPESLTYTSTTIQPKQITFESNVWSLGVTMWEIYECGAQPYARLNDDEVISQVLGSTNIRLSVPKFPVFYIDYIFRLMQMCWSTSEESRPSVTQIHLMLSDLMQVYRNYHTSTTLIELPVSIQDFDRRWESFKPNSVARTDNHDFKDENKSIDSNDISVLNVNLDKDELLSTKTISPSLNNLHGSLDNLVCNEMDSWLQKVATKTGDMSYVRGLSEAIKDLDNALALENVSSSDSSHQPSPAPENLSRTNRLEFKLGPTAKISKTNFTNITQNDDLMESSIRLTSSESETEDENWRKKIERGAYSEKVHQKSKSVTDLMILTHIDYSESDSETPLPSMDYRVNYKNVRYAAPRQNLENVSLTFGSEGNLLSIHDKFQDELRRLKEERKDSLLFVPESVSHNNEKYVEKDVRNVYGSSSSDEETYITNKDNGTTRTYVNTNFTINTNNKNDLPAHGNPESLIEELSNPSEIQPGNQIYNIFSVTINANFSPIHIKPVLKDVICYNDSKNNESCDTKMALKDCNEYHFEGYQVPRLVDIIQNNDQLMDYIINKYESPEDEVLQNERKDINPVLENCDVQLATREFLEREKSCYEASSAVQLKFDVSLTQQAILPNNSMIQPIVFTSTPTSGKHFESVISPPILDLSLEKQEEFLQFSSNFLDDDVRSELEYSLETWDNFLVNALDDSGKRNEFEEFTSEPRSTLFTDEDNDLKSEVYKNEVPVEEKHDLSAEQNNVTVTNDVQGISNGTKENCLAKESVDIQVLNENNIDQTFDVTKNNFENVKVYSAKKYSPNKTFVIEGVDALDTRQLLNTTYIKDSEDSGNNNWGSDEGWFLHSQTNSEISGQIEITARGDTESYVGFSMDDEIMAAIRNELLMKLPQAQGQSHEQLKESDDWDLEERNEVLIKYNVYTTPLSPIPEESYSEHDSYHLSYNQVNGSDSENEDWPEPFEEHNNSSHRNIESPIQGACCRHTPSQDSCCSSDTLFNLEELTYVMNENDKVKDSNDVDKKSSDLNDKKIEQINIERGCVCKYVTLRIDENESQNEQTFMNIKNDRIFKTENPNSKESIDNNVFIEHDKKNMDVNYRNTLKHTFEGNNENVLMETNDCEENNQTYERKLHINQAVMEFDIKISIEDIFANVLANNIVNEHLKEHSIQRKTKNSEIEIASDLSQSYNHVSVNDNENYKSVSSSQIEEVLNSNGNQHLMLKRESMPMKSTELGNYSKEDTERNEIVADLCIEIFENSLNCRTDINTKTDLLIPNHMEDALPENFENYQNPKTSHNEVKTPTENDYNKQTMKNSNSTTQEHESNTSNLNVNMHNSEHSLDENNINFINCMNPNVGLTNDVSGEIKGNVDLLLNNSDNSTLFSLLIKNNPNYMMEFLNHERQTDICNYESCSKDDYPQNFSKSEATYVNVEDIKITFAEGPFDLEHSTTPDHVNASGFQSLIHSNSLEDVSVKCDKVKEYLCNPEAHDNANADIYDTLTDIRFTGPGDAQLMSTSFSESVDIDDQDWDSGSDTRSSSSGEFIWKEGEHEESVKALRAAPQDVIASEKMLPMEEIEEVTSESSDDDNGDDDDDDDGDGDSPEFVPSAWDKYATPTKSALRSPEKTLERIEPKTKKPKGVWFKKQKYHCVYEYPREPESPNINSYELWQTVPSVMDWEINPHTVSIDRTDMESDYCQNKNVYQPLGFAAGMTTLDDEFFISSTAKPFETFSGLSSQFFPGQSMSNQWLDLTKQSNENVTPDSGVEDITPANHTDNDDFTQAVQMPSRVQSLQLLAAAALKNNQITELKNNRGSLGDLRHARNKLKLDLPPSPSAFTSTRTFAIEPLEEPVAKREVPTFTTFGKSRFLVQHVDTPTCDDENQKRNVSFEALPYKPIQIEKGKVEIVRGEASLLDSADEDSGIESSTLERKKIANLTDRK